MYGLATVSQSSVYTAQTVHFVHNMYTLYIHHYYTVVQKKWSTHI